MADTQLRLVEKAVMDVVLSREGRRRYNNGDPLTLDPSDLRDIVRLTMAKCADLASRPAEVDDSRVKADAALWDLAMSHAAMYVEHHCLDGEEHAKHIMSMYRPEFKLAPSHTTNKEK